MKDRYDAETVARLIAQMLRHAAANPDPFWQDLSKGANGPAYDHFHFRGSAPGTLQVVEVRHNIDPDDKERFDYLRSVARDTAPVYVKFERAYRWTVT